MSSGGDERARQTSALDRELGTIGTQSVLLSQVVADRLGLHTRDVEVLDILNRGGARTAGELAELSGLTTGALTRLIDRLERAGYVRREPNPRDRRSVIVVPIAERLARDIAPLYAPLERELTDLYARYSEEELALLADFVGRVNAAVREHIARLRAMAPDGSPDR